MKFNELATIENFLRKFYMMLVPYDLDIVKNQQRTEDCENSLELFNITKLNCLRWYMLMYKKEERDA